MTAIAALPFTFTRTAVPQETRGGRKADPNPYVDVVTGLYTEVVDKNTVEALSFHLPTEGKSEKDVATETGRVIRQLRAVGANAEKPYTVRTKSEPSSTSTGKGANAKTVPTILVTFWIHTVNADGKKVPTLIEKRRGESTNPADAE
jgi:hypothetical protein